MNPAGASLTRTLTPYAEIVMTNVAQVPATEVPAGAYLLDVREHEEWDAGHVPGAVHIPLGELGARYTELEQDQPLYVICRSGIRSDHAAQALAGAGWDASNVADGMMGWQAAGLPMTSESGQPYVA
jgi:rhodanese-related sulfurtransferase